MNKPVLVFSIALALLVPSALAVDVGIPDVGTAEAPKGAGQSIVGFYELPEDRSQYGGFRVVFVDEELKFFTVEGLPEVVQVQASLDDNVRYVETDVSDHQLFYSPNDYFVAHSSNWGMNKIGLGVAWDRTLGSTSVKDGHIDSGIVATHEDISGSRFQTGWDYYQNDGTPQDTQYCNWHGSHTTGTVAATINNAKGFPGTAQITVRPLKIFHGINGGPYGCAATSTTGISNAIRATRDNGAQISSNSWGGGAYSTAINDAINYARAGGVIFIASSGNGGCSNCVGNPWVTQEANVIIVTATDVNDAGASFNSKGPQTDVSAPGVGIGSAGGPGNSYYVMSGTSMACPYVAGVAALIKTLNPSFTELDVESRLKSTAKDLGAAGEDDTFGAGRIQANLAVY